MYIFAFNEFIRKDLLQKIAEQLGIRLEISPDPIIWARTPQEITATERTVKVMDLAGDTGRVLEAFQGLGFRKVDVPDLVDEVEVRKTLILGSLEEMGNLAALSKGWRFRIDPHCNLVAELVTKERTTHRCPRLTDRLVFRLELLDLHRGPSV